MDYRIEFWNEEDAEVPTQDADIVDDLDPDAFDFETFEFTRIGFLDWDVYLPGGQEIDEWIDARPTMNIAVHVTANFDPESGRIYWWFHCVDPDTGDYPDDPNVGFLPPFNPETQYELGWVEYRVRTKPALDDGTEILNQARVRFDFLPWGDPPPPEERWDEGAWGDETAEHRWGPAPKEGPWLNTIDAAAPVSQVEPLAAVSPRNFEVTWSGTDTRSGIAYYDVDVSREGAPYQHWYRSADRNAIALFEPGVSYEFYSVAVNHVGHVVTIDATNEQPGFFVIQIE